MDQMCVVDKIDDEISSSCSGFTGLTRFINSVNAQWKLVAGIGSLLILILLLTVSLVTMVTLEPDNGQEQEVHKARKPISSCSVAMENLPSPRSTKQWIYPHGNGTKIEVLCDFDVDGGGWTVIQKTSSGPRLDFNRNWTEYSKGFGSLDGNFWLGLENMHALTKNGDQELRIELEDFEGNNAWAKYWNFSISDASDFYRLKISGFFGGSTAGDSITNSTGPSGGLLNGMRFSTKDKDNYLNSSNCAGRLGGWWFNACSITELNGPYKKKGEDGDGMRWHTWKGWEPMAKTEIKTRKRKP